MKNLVKIIGAGMISAVTAFSPTYTPAGEGIQIGGFNFHKDVVVSQKVVNVPVYKDVPVYAHTCEGEGFLGYQHRLQGYCPQVKTITKERIHVTHEKQCRPKPREYSCAPATCRPKTCAPATFMPKPCAPATCAPRPSYTPRPHAPATCRPKTCAPATCAPFDSQSRIYQDSAITSMPSVCIEDLPEVDNKPDQSTLAHSKY